MIAAIAAVALGAAMLAVFADQFVIGAARVAVIKRIPAIVVGVVIIGFGTSSPELLVSALASAGGEPAIAVGNVVGSNLSNLSLLLGVGAILIPIHVESRTVLRESLICVAATLLFFVFIQGGGIAAYEGAILTALLGPALYLVTRGSRRGDQLGVDAVELADVQMHGFRAEIVRTVVGLVGTIGAAQLLLWGAVELAERAGLSGGFVGATLVALGTSLPEMVTVVQSARRGETDLIVGNLLGSNLFNALGVGGVIGLIGGTMIDDRSLTLVAGIAMLVVVLGATAAMWTNRRVSRLEGVVLVASYVAIVPFLQ